MGVEFIWVSQKLHGIVVEPDLDELHEAGVFNVRHVLCMH